MSIEKKYSLPNMTFDFSIAVVGRETGHKWAGKFKYKRPTLGDRTRIDAMRARLSGDLETLNHEVSEFIEAVSHLRFTLTEYPDWWQEMGFGLEMHDGNVVSEVYNRCLDYESDYREKMFSGVKSDVEEKVDEFGNVPESPDTIIATTGSIGQTEAGI